MPPAILVVTGASGVGKTAAVQTLEARRLPGVACHYFDSLGVPTPEEMERDYGGGDGWQAAMTRRWVDTITAGDADVAVLDGQTRPSFVRAALAAHREPIAQIVLLDCDPEERTRRLRDQRGQPELATPRMDAWAVYLRGQADALGLPVLDTTQRSISETAALLEVEVERLRRLRRESTGDSFTANLEQS